MRYWSGFSFSVCFPAIPNPELSAKQDHCFLELLLLHFGANSHLNHPWRRRKPMKYSVVDVFTDSPFNWNPAVVGLLEEDRDHRWLQAVADEFNISEKCYLTRTAANSDKSTPSRFGLRCFTPTNEVEICGRATLAAAYTIFKIRSPLQLNNGADQRHTCTMFNYR